MTARHIEMLRIESIRLDFQSAEHLDYEKVEEYAADVRSGGRLSPVRVNFDGETYWLGDGFHRIAAARLVGLEEISAEVVHGTYADLESEWNEYLRTLRDSLRADAH